jgi:hypothetical protein
LFENVLEPIQESWHRAKRILKKIIADNLRLIGKILLLLSIATTL